MIHVYPAHIDEPEQRMGWIHASDAARLLKAYTYYTEDPDSPTGKGYQRPPTPSRFPKIASDIAAHGCTPLTLSDRGRWRSLLSRTDAIIRMSFPELMKALGVGESEVESVLLSIVDGQHRNGGALWLLNSQRADAVLPFVLFHGLTWAEEVERFNTINTTAKNLPRALVEVNKYTTFNPATASKAEKLHHEVHEVVMRLATDADSIWNEQVNMTGGRNADRPITFEGLRRSTEATFSGRLALVPVEKKVLMAKYYWAAVAATWTKAWHNMPEINEWVDTRTGQEHAEEIPVRYRIKELAGVSALAKLANDILSEAYDFDTGAVNTALIRARLSRAADLSWVRADDNPDMSGQAGFSGRAALYDTLRERIYGTQAVA
jgi:DGQHR domain-containing protein